MYKTNVQMQQDLKTVKVLTTAIKQAALQTEKLLEKWENV